MSIARNLSWTFASRMGSQVTQLLVSLFLARMITPAEFGLIGMLMVFSGFATVVGEAGLNSALIYVDKVDEDVFSTTFWIQFAINLCFTALFFFGAGLIADFYNAPTLRPLTQLMSVNFVLQSVGQIQNAMLVRQMNFRTIGIITYASVVVSSVTALVLAWLGYGVWALVWHAIATNVTMLIGTSIATRWHPRLRFSVPVMSQVMSYGSYLLMYNSLNYWMRNGDNLLIGKALGNVSLGMYNRAYTLMLLPLQNVGAIVGQVMFPTLSRLRDDPAAFRVLYLQSIRRISFVAFPIMGGLSILAEPLIRILYGPQWGASAPILQILGIVGLFQCIIFPVGWIFNALGHNKTQFRLTVALVPPFFILVGGGLHYGLLGVTWGYAAWAVLSGVLHIHVAGRLIDVGIREYLELVVRKAAATAAMILVIALVDPWARAQLGLICGTSLCVLLGAGVYGAALGAIRDPDLAPLVAHGRPFFRKLGWV